MEVKRNNVYTSAEESVSIKEYGRYRLKDLVRKLKNDLKISEKEAIEKVYSMYTRSDIDTMPMARDFVDYLRTSIAKKYMIIITISIIGLLFINLNVFYVLRAMFGILLLFYLPGYSLLESLHISVSSGLEKIILSISLSITLLLFIGLLLNYSPWGLNILPLTATITAIIILLVIAALFRNYKRLGSNSLY